MSAFVLTASGLEPSPARLRSLGTNPDSVANEYIAAWLIQRHPFAFGAFTIPATTMTTAS
ncbi:MAG: hypothetical protein ABI556_04010 [Gemmatimonadales bacterium]